MAVVIDSSIALEWMLGQERAEAAGLVFTRREELLVHPLFWLEVVHVLAKQMRGGGLSCLQRDEAWSALRSMQLTNVPGDVAHALLPEVIVLTDRYRLSAYDAAHLATALHLDVPLATFDSSLAAAARGAGGSLLDLGAGPTA